MKINEAESMSWHLPSDIFSVKDWRNELAKADGGCVVIQNPMTKHFLRSPQPNQSCLCVYVTRKGDINNYIRYGSVEQTVKTKYDSKWYPQGLSISSAVNSNPQNFIVVTESPKCAVAFQSCAIHLGKLRNGLPQSWASVIYRIEVNDTDLYFLGARYTNLQNGKPTQSYQLIKQSFVGDPTVQGPQTFDEIAQTVDIKPAIPIADFLRGVPFEENEVTIETLFEISQNS